MSDFGNYLRKTREDKKLSVNQLGIYAGVSPGLISKIENGKRGVPKPETIEKLAKGLKIDYVIMMRKAGYIDGESEKNDNEIKLTSKQEKLMKEIKNLDDETIDFLEGILDRIEKKQGD